MRFLIVLKYTANVGYVTSRTKEKYDIGKM